MAFNPSKDSGFPTGYDYNSPGSELTAKNRLQTPAGFNSSAPSAALNKYQDTQTTVPIGVPGTTYTPHTADQVYSTVGGHFMIYGNAPGSETIRLQSKAGAAIELSSDGSIRVVSAKGLHLSINGDNQIVLQGDYAITTNGAMKFKAGSIIFDTAEMIMNVRGDMTQYVDGDLNQEITGDKHTTVVGDNSNMVGGNQRNTVAGEQRDQVIEDRKIETGGDHRNLTKGSYIVSSIGQMFHMTNNNHLTSVMGGYSVTSKGNTSISSQSVLDLTAASTTTIGSKSSVDIVSNSTIQMTSQSTMKLDSQANIYFTSATNIDGYAPRIDWNKQARSAATVNAPGVGVPAAATWPEIPDKNLVLDSISDFVATGGQFDNLTTAEQVSLLYTESEEGASVPQEILDRLAEKGIEYPPKTVGTIVTTVNTDALKSNLTDTQDGWNPGVT